MSQQRFPRRVGVLGGRKASAEGLAFAVELGQYLAERGSMVYCGGGTGVMEAVAKGAHAGNGTVVGILKEEDGSDANPFVDVPVATGMGDLRNGIILRSVECAIAVEGAYGTLSEIAYALSGQKPIFGFHSWDIPGLIPVSTISELMAHLEGLAP